MAVPRDVVGGEVPEQGHGIGVVRWKPHRRWVTSRIKGHITDVVGQQGCVLGPQKDSILGGATGNHSSTHELVKGVLRDLPVGEGEAELRDVSCTLFGDADQTALVTKLLRESLQLLAGLAVWTIPCTKLDRVKIYMGWQLSDIVMGV